MPDKVTEELILFQEIRIHKVFITKGDTWLRITEDGIEKEAFNGFSIPEIERMYQEALIEIRKQAEAHHWLEVKQ